MLRANPQCAANDALRATDAGALRLSVRLLEPALSSALLANLRALLLPGEAAASLACRDFDSPEQRELRRLLRIDGETAAEVDMANAQPFFLLSLYPVGQHAERARTVSRLT